MLSCTLTHTPKKKLSILKNPNMHNFTQNWTDVPNNLIISYGFF
jgi:hypothetical protein